MIFYQQVNDQEKVLSHQQPLVSIKNRGKMREKRAGAQEGTGGPWKVPVKRAE